MVRPVSDAPAGNRRVSSGGVRSIHRSRAIQKIFDHFEAFPGVGQEEVMSGRLDAFQPDGRKPAGYRFYLLERSDLIQMPVYPQDRFLDQFFQDRIDPVHYASPVSITSRPL